MLDELKPCPFCGHKAELVTIPNAGSGQPGIRYIACTYDGCAASGGSHPLKVAAISCWNRRFKTTDEEKS